MRYWSIPVFKNDLLQGRAIFLSGGGSGLGRSMAIYFASLGAKLFVIGRREEPLASRRVIKERGG